MLQSAFQQRGPIVASLALGIEIDDAPGNTRACNPPSRPTADTIFGNTDVISALVDGDNARGNDVRASAVVTYRRLAGTTTPNSNFAPGKFGLAVDMIEKNVNTTRAILSLTINAGTPPTVTFALAGTDNPFQSNRFVSIKGLAGNAGAAFNNRTYKIQSLVENPPTITVRQYVREVPLDTCTPTLVDILSAVPGWYSAPIVDCAGIAGTGGTSIGELRFIRQYMLSNGATWLEMFQNFADFQTYSGSGTRYTSDAMANLVTSTIKTSASGISVTKYTSLSVSFAAGDAIYFQGLSSLPEMNGSNFNVSAVVSTTVSLGNYDSYLLSDGDTDGSAINAKQRSVSTKIGVLALGLGRIAAF